MGSCLGRSSHSKSSSNNSLVSSCLGHHATDDQERDLMSNLNEHYKRDNFIYRIMNFKRKKKSSHFLEKFWQYQDTSYAKLSSGPQAESISDIQLQNLDVTNLLLNAAHSQKESSINNIASRVPSSRGSSSLDLEWEHEYSQIRQYPQLLRNSKYVCLQQQHQMNHEMLTQILQTETSADESSWQYNNIHEDGQLHSMASMPSLGLHNDSLQMPNNLENFKECSNEKRPLIRTRSRSQRLGSITRNSSHNSWSHISTPESLEWDIDEEQQNQLYVEDDNLDHETLKLLHQIEQLKNRVLYETGEGLFVDFEDRAKTFDNDNDLSRKTFHTMFEGAAKHTCFQLAESDGENANFS
ncbi:uncharacterized protein LOC119640276 [Glossina fuscipes]|uniref:Uncharacterized protein LOC119640276 n=1 Tax=Glossina fuscipes TaxID=7396 RepID=A0A9C5ZCT2_9MUSC|nr:uncharacterized protein LOC119640276 [Glossina fuscipes]